MAKGYDFETLARNLLGEGLSFISSLLPGGKLIGREWTCGDKTGSDGNSLKVNISTGKWSDFATGDSGGDLISLYAYVKGLTNGEAYRELDGSVDLGLTKQSKPSAVVNKPMSLDPNIVKPPANARKTFLSTQTVYNYKDINNELMFYVERIDKPDGGKIFKPHCYTDKGKWVNKMWPENRPLYNLPSLKASDKPVLIVEGEKAVAAAYKLIGHKYNVVTSIGGASAWKRTDWSPLKGKSVLIWPDADEPGNKYGEAVATHLSNDYDCKEIKILKTDGLPKGYDAADFKYPKADFIKWAKARVYVFNPVERPVEVMPPAPPMEMYQNVPIPHDEPYSPSVVDVQQPPPFSPHRELWIKLGLALNSDQVPRTSMSNMYKIVEKHVKYKDKIWFDTFHQTERTDYDSKSPRELRDSDYSRIQMFIQDKMGIQGAVKNNIIDAVNLYARDNERSEPKEWLESLEWDKKPRIVKFFRDYFGTVDDLYHDCVSRNMWVAMVARIYIPGCKADNMVILEGKQGSFKSTALNVIGGKWYTESNEKIGSKDFPAVMHGNIICEIGELDSFSKAEATTIKKVISTAKDRYRTPYDRKPATHPRQSILVGTTNEAAYLRDVTGARRFWPIKTKRIDLEALKADRDQLFAEAVALFKMGEAWHEVPDELTKAVQEERREVDIWEGLIDSWLETHTPERVNPTMIATHCLDFKNDRLDVRASRRISKCLKALGYELTKHSRAVFKLAGSEYKYKGKVYMRSDSDYFTGHDMETNATAQTELPQM